MNKPLAIGLSSLLVVIQTALAGPLDSALERMNNFNRSEWSFQKISAAEEHRVELHNPSEKPEWTLLSVDSELPSQKQLKSYQTNKAKQEEKREEKSRGKLNLHEIIDVNSLTLIEEGTESDKYSFQPIIDEGDFADSLSGELWHNKRQDFIEQFGFHNISPFSPILGVKIKKMRTSFKFKEIGTGIFAPDQITTEVSGKAFGLKKIDENQLQTYRLYQAITTE